MMMNIGMASSAKLSSLPNRISGISSSERIPSKTIRNPADTTRSPIATDMPEKSTTTVTRATSPPRASGSTYSSSPNGGSSPRATA